MEETGDVTRILDAIEDGDVHAAEELLPVVYDALRRLAAQRMSHERANHTLGPTALVHEVYLRLVDTEKAQRWQNRAHFFGAAAEAMRRILIEHARSRGRQKRGGDRRRIDLDAVDPCAAASPEEIVALDEALSQLAEEDAQAHALVRLRLFAGLSVTEAGELLGLARTSAYELWSFARACLRVALDATADEPPPNGA